MNKKYITLFILVSILRGTVSLAQVKLTPTQYIELYAATAVREMEESGIPASITLAQGLLESDNGNSPLATTANNHFGIKCHKEWTGDTYFHDDDEKNECFRYYQNAAQSYDDHTEFLKTRSRYAFLFSFSNTDYVAWANGLKLAGYATNPQYPTMLVNIINRYELSKYDLMLSKEMLVKQEISKPVEVVKTLPVQSPININKKPFDEEVVIEIQPFYNEVFLLNNIKAIKAKTGDTPMGIAMKYNVPINYLYKYNDMYEGENFTEGQNIFIQPKRNKGYAKQHLVLEGESMFEIAQKYGVKLTELYKKNNLELGVEVYPGERVTLRDDNENTPKNLSYEEFLLLKNKHNNSKAITDKSTETKQTQVINTPNLSIDQIQKSIDQKTIENRNTEAEKSNEVKVAIKEPVQTTTLSDVSAAEQITMTDSKANIGTNKPKEIVLTQNPPTLNHLVKQGDTLYNISKRYGVSVSNIVLWNNIVDNSIKLGQNLIIGK